LEHFRTALALALFQLSRYMAHVYTGNLGFPSSVTYIVYTERGIKIECVPKYRA